MEWISVEDRLPMDRDGDGEPDLVVVIEGFDMFLKKIRYWSESTFYAGETPHWYDGDGNPQDYGGDKVTHWMSIKLPPPPELMRRAVLD